MIIDKTFEQKQMILKCGAMLDMKNMSPATSGNISVRVGDNIYISATETALGDLCMNDIVQLDIDANKISKGKNPSSEKNMHCAIYKKRPDINAIIHCHSPYASAFAVCHEPINQPIISESIFYFGEIPVAPYALPGSEQLAQNAAQLFENHDAVLLANHGIIIGAKDLKTAYYLCETAETVAQIFINARILGGAKELSSNDVEEIHNLRNSIRK